jgi:hypothetical protein
MLRSPHAVHSMRQSSVSTSRRRCLRGDETKFHGVGTTIAFALNLRRRKNYLSRTRRSTLSRSHLASEIFLDRGLAEMERVLRPRGMAIVLEFSRPRGRVWGLLYRFYSLHVLPIVGGIISRNREAYEYLPRTATEFPDGDAFARILMTAGFSEVRWYTQCGGIATIYAATK